MSYVPDSSLTYKVVFFYYEESFQNRHLVRPLNLSKTYEMVFSTKNLETKLLFHALTSLKLSCSF